MTLAPTYRRRLREHSLGQYGFVTARAAEAMGIPAVELRKLHQRGGLERVGHGLYRFDDVARTGKEQFMEAVLRVGPGAVLARDAVLALHDLALANPRRLRVATDRRVRVSLPDFVEVERRAVAPADRTSYEGVPCTTLAQALVDSRDLIMAERLVEAVREAVRSGLLRKSEADRVLAEIGTDG